MLACTSCRHGFLAGGFPAGIIGLAVLLSSAPVQGQVREWLPDTSLQFATEDEAAAVLTRVDAFVLAQSQFDRQSRMGVGGQPSRGDYLAFVRAQILPWTPADQERVTSALLALKDRLHGWRLPLPPTLLLVRTTGREEAQAAYCRGHAIVLPTQVLATSPESLERLLAHELFHIVSNQAPQRVQALYKLIGFEACPPIQLPTELQPLKITNPDAPFSNCHIGLRVAGKAVRATPVLLASGPYQPERRDSFFAYLTFRLLVVEQVAEGWRPVLREGAPWLLASTDTPDYRQQIGGNTKYIIHPEEILADNFMHAVMQTSDLPDVQIVERLRQALQS